ASRLCDRKRAFGTVMGVEPKVSEKLSRETLNKRYFRPRSKFGVIAYFAPRIACQASLLLESEKLTAPYGWLGRLCRVSSMCRCRRACSQAPLRYGPDRNHNRRSRRRRNPSCDRW